MKKINEKNLIIILIIALLLNIFSFLEEKTVKADNIKSIDMYLIAGQSNAAGYSTYGDISGIYPNIMYGGETDRNMNTLNSASRFLTTSTFKNAVSEGLGTNVTRIGPEFGMAKILNDYYTGTDKAFIFKSAAGGTSLQDAKTGSSGNSAYGNWYPRSLWEEDYVPNITTANSTPTGVQYALFVENFKTVYNQLVVSGYNPLVKGMVWMQGEEDWGLGCDDYDVLLKQFIADIREDLYNITNDENVIDMRFVIGKIATSFSTPTNNIVSTINKKQQAVADEMNYVETVETSDLIITYYDENGAIQHKGVDNYHFSGADAVVLGERFATKLLSMETSTDGRIVLKNQNGTTDYQYDATTNTIILKDFIPNSGYSLSSISVNGKVLYIAGRNNLINGEYTLNLSDILESAIRYKISVNYTEITQRITVVCDEDRGKVIIIGGSLTQIKGDTVKFKVQTYSGYMVDKIFFNDALITADENMQYSIIILEGKNQITALFVKDERETPALSAPDKSDKTVVLIILSAIVVLTIVIIGMVNEKKRKKIK